MKLILLFNNNEHPNYGEPRKMQFIRWWFGWLCLESAVASAKGHKTASHRNPRVHHESLSSYSSSSSASSSSCSSELGDHSINKEYSVHHENSYFVPRQNKNKHKMHEPSFQHSKGPKQRNYSNKKYHKSYTNKSSQIPLLGHKVNIKPESQYSEKYKHLVHQTHHQRIPSHNDTRSLKDKPFRPRTKGFLKHHPKQLKSSHGNYFNWPKWLPDYDHYRSISPKWKKEKDCLYAYRSYVRPYPNNCYGQTHSFGSMIPVWQQFWKEIRGDLSFTFDTVLWSDTELYSYTDQFWYLIAYLRHLSLLIKNPRDVGANQFDSSETHYFIMEIDLLLKHHKDLQEAFTHEIDDTITYLKKTAQNCGEKAEFELCPNPCQPRNCTQNFVGMGCNQNQINAVALRKFPDPECPKPACRCKPGFFYNKKGLCTSQEQCFTCAGGEIPECPTYCPERRCDAILTRVEHYCKWEGVNQTCPQVPVCHCAPGFYRDAAGRCVNPELCNLCPEDHVLDMCPNECEMSLRTCKGVYSGVTCPHTKPPPQCPLPRCRCKDNKLLNDRGFCQDKEKCLQCPYNEVPSCPDPACLERLCDGTWTDNPCKPSQQYPECDQPPICRCRDGFVRKNTKCVLQQECFWCPSDEVPVCPTYCTERRCDNIINQVQRDCKWEGDNLQCPWKPLCYCAPGLYRDSHGRCVVKDLCNLCTDGQIVDMCPYECELSLRTCKGVYSGIVCPHVEPPAQCGLPRCRCEDKTLLNDRGYCQLKEKCLQCPYNEVPSCPDPACPERICDGTWTDNPCKPSQQYPECTQPPICRCRDGFVRKNTKCVLQQECLKCTDASARLVCKNDACNESTGYDYVNHRGRHPCPVGLYAAATCHTQPQCHCQFPTLRDNTCVNIQKVVSSLKNCTAGMKNDSRFTSFGAIACGDGCRQPSCNDRYRAKCPNSDQALYFCNNIICQCREGFYYHTYPGIPGHCHTSKYCP